MANVSSGTVAVKGLTDLNRAFKRADRDLRLGWRKELRSVAEPVRAFAETKALQEIPNMRRSPGWALMRVGVTAHAVYVAPRKRGLKGDSRRKRRNLAPLLLERAMEPALRQNETEIVHRLERLIDTVGRDWERG